MFTRVFLILGLIVVVLLVVVATRPDTFTVSRSTIIAAPPAVVYGHVADFSKWQAWSPWAQLDPSQKMTFGGTPGQAGSTYTWAGNKQVGEGRMTILKAEAPALVDIKLEFLKPFEATNDTSFAFTPSGANTLAVWTMSGNNNFMGKAMGLFMNMDKMVGGDFERGLAQLKTITEADAAQAATASPAPAVASPAQAAPAAPTDKK